MTQRKRPEDKLKTGRPSRYKPEFCILATQFCKLGMTNPQLSKAFDVSLSTLKRWLQDKPEFQAAIKKGRIFADAEVAEGLFKKATGYTLNKRHYPPDTAAAFIWLKNRRPDLWRDKVREVDDTPLATPVAITIVTEDCSIKGGDNDGQKT